MAQTRGSVRQRKTKQSDQPVPGSELPPYNARVEELSTSDEEGEDETVSTEPAKKSKKSKKSAREAVDDEDAYSPWVDVLRVISFLFFFSCGVSYLISGGESFFWGVKKLPFYMKADWWKDQLRGPLTLTPEELAVYDGSNPALPLYLGLNGSIYDVSSNPRIYGPGGSYGHFTGVDGARAFVTGCFADDLTADMRGAEEMFLPIDDPEIDAQLGIESEEEWAALRAKELEVAKQKVQDALGHWVKFFGSGSRYRKVGTIKREENWFEKEPRRGLCAQALKSRKKRTIPKGE